MLCLQWDSDHSVHPWLLIRECSHLFEVGDPVDVESDTVQNGGGVLANVCVGVEFGLSGKHTRISVFKMLPKYGVCSL